MLPTTVPVAVFQRKETASPVWNAVSVAVTLAPGDADVELSVTVAVTVNVATADLPVGPTTMIACVPAGSPAMLSVAEKLPALVTDAVDSNPTSTRVVDASSDQGDVTVGYRAR